MKQWAFAWVALSLAAAADGRTPQNFPQEVIDAGGGYLKIFDEPPLWQPSARRGYSERLRFLIGGSTRATWVIRIDRRPDGHTIAYFAKHDGHQIVEDEEYRVSEKDYQELQQLIRDAKLWSIYPEFYQFTDDRAICIDGMLVIFERTNAAGYRYSEGNAQCTLGAGQLAVAAKFMEIAKHSGLERLLR